MSTKGAGTKALSDTQRNKRRRSETAVAALCKHAQKLGERAVLVGWVNDQGITHGYASSYLEGFVSDPQNGLQKLLRTGHVQGDSTTSAQAAQAKASRILKTFRSAKDAFEKQLFNVKHLKDLLRAANFSELQTIWQKWQNSGKDEPTASKVPNHMQKMEIAWIDVGKKATNRIHVGNKATSSNTHAKQSDKSRLHGENGKFSCPFEEDINNLLDLRKWNKEAAEATPPDRDIIKVNEILRGCGKDFDKYQRHELLCCLGILLHWHNEGMCPLPPSTQHLATLRSTHTLTHSLTHTHTNPTKKWTNTQTNYSTLEQHADNHAQENITKQDENIPKKTILSVAKYIFRQITFTKKRPQTTWFLCGTKSRNHQFGQTYLVMTKDSLWNKKQLCSTVCSFLCFL
jgi:hypothetical protein